MSDGDPESPSPEDHHESLLSKELKRIKSATLEAAEKRGRLPQPLFWSLFQSRIREIRETKAKLRCVKELLGQ